MCKKGSIIGTWVVLLYSASDRSYEILIEATQTPGWHLNMIHYSIFTTVGCIQNAWVCVLCLNTNLPTFTPSFLHLFLCHGTEQNKRTWMKCRNCHLGSCVGQLPRWLFLGRKEILPVAFLKWFNSKQPSVVSYITSTFEWCQYIPHKEIALYLDRISDSLCSN